MQSSAIMTLTTLMHSRTQKFLVDTFALYSVALHVSSLETSGSHLTFKMCPVLIHMAHSFQCSFITHAN